MTSIGFRSLYYYALAYALFLLPVASYRSGFWYGNLRPPELMYESLAYANLTVKVDQSYHDGPGQNLVTDPLNSSRILYVGNTINRQTFDTQFILDMQYAIGIEPERVFVQYVARGGVHFTWESSTVEVNFIFLERNSSSSLTLLECVAELTMQIQTPTSKLYHGTNVTVDIDPLWGLVEVTWDLSLRLTYAIAIIGEDSVKDGYYLNQGSLGTCDTPASVNNSAYCEFERFFEDDVSRALNITWYRVQVLFIKAASYDSVIVHFRIDPPNKDAHKEDNITSAIANLALQVADNSSSLYAGNVTLRVDPTWGVSQDLQSPRTRGALFTRAYYEYDPDRLKDPRRSTLITPYGRCKANRRCNWGVVELDQHTNDARFFHRLFDRGVLYDTQLFLDFEDWRMGSRGFSWNAYLPPSALGETSSPRVRAKNGIIRGAHFWPFDQPSLGPDIPCFMTERNQGLVLDRSLQSAQIIQQETLVEDLMGQINWLTDNIETAVMGPQLRSRKDVKTNLSDVRLDIINWLDNEQVELTSLTSSQCVNTPCRIQFNTSSLLLTGAINGTGEVKQTAQGTEVALFSFNSIYLGPEVQVTVVGQRALSLLSKTTAVINTTIDITPGTLGGFQGGGSVARLASEMYVDDPQYVYICSLGGYCSIPTIEQATNQPSSQPTGQPTDQPSGQPSSHPTGITSSPTAFYPSSLPSSFPTASPTASLAPILFSNNVNGPGSGNLRINPFLIRTSATHIPEVQKIVTSAAAGQTLSGGFTLHFKEFSTPIIQHDVPSLTLKQIIEDNLNLMNPNSVVFPDRNAGRAGVGFVSVSRSKPDPQEGFTWLITFDSAIGNIDQITATTWLWADGAATNIVTSTVVQGNELGGTFQLSFQGAKTAPIKAAETAGGLQAKLLGLPMVSTAFVDRIDPTGNCDDGLCPNGPYPARGLLWIVYITTNLNWDDVTPTSPTSPEALEVAPFYNFTALSNGLLGASADVEVILSTAGSPNFPQNLLSVTFPFSLAFGGAGASYGGLGGKGYGENPQGPIYNDRYLADLLGGSGGCMAQADPFAINAALGPVNGLGGHGGGAIEIVAASDLTVGSYGKFIARGGDGQQTSGGGGGGGSGGAILLAAGTVVKVEGTLDVSGGDGGFGGFTSLELAGGGGGGGRIAIYADSVVTTSATIITSGGRCGVYKITGEHNALFVDGSATFQSLLPLDAARAAHLANLHLAAFVGTPLLDITSVRNSGGMVKANFSLTYLDANATLTLLTLKKGMNAAIGVNIAEFTFIKGQVLNSSSGSYEQIDSTIPAACTNAGGDGTYFSEALMTTSMYVGSTDAAEGTSRAFFMSNNEMTNTSTGSPREVPLSWNGPTVSFEPSRPGRITYYTRTDAVPSESKKYGYGSLFSLISRGEAGLNVSNVIGVYFGWSIMHGANFGSAVDENTFFKRLVTIDSSPSLATWYKVDIKIQWDNHTYSVAINDAIVTYQQPFEAEDVDGIRLSVWRAVDVWFDEIYVGFDNTMDFSCPITTRQGTSTASPVQKGWSFDEVHGGDSNGYTEYKQMQRHYNFLETTGSIPFDGQGAVKDFQDIKLQYAEGDYPWIQGKINAGALVYLTNSTRSKRVPLVQSATLDSPKGLWYSGADRNIGDGRHYWYSEYNYKSLLYPSLNGGVTACSSQDLNSWRYEGVVFHYTNLTDMVYGYTDSFYIERPKVLFNHVTNEYVMWAVMDRSQRDMAMNMIASSPFEDGPFLFRRSFYPDGNQTRDQVIFVNEEGNTVLARTYYQTVEYILPQVCAKHICYCNSF